MRLAAVAAFALVLALPATVEAQNKAWGAAVRIMLARDSDAAEIAATVKRVCGIEAADSVNSITFNAADPRTGKPSGVVLIALAGADEARLRDCARKYGKATGKPVTLTKGADGVTEVSHQHEHLLVAFPKPRTMAVAFDTSERPVLAAMLARSPPPPPTTAPRTTRTLHWIERRLRDLAALVAIVQNTGMEGLALEITVQVEAAEQHLRDLF